MEQAENSIITGGQDGRVNISLQEYNQMRDTIVNLVETTKTHKEFIKDFRLSLINIVAKAEEIGLDLGQIYEYYESLDFKPIESLGFVQGDDITKLIIKLQESKKKTLKDIVQ